MHYIEPVHHYALLEHVVGLASGVAVEFGVASGQSTRIIAEHMPVVGFDSFRGLPADWRDGYPKGKFAHEPPEIDNCELVIGLFDDTVPGYDFPEVGLIHVDCDLYSSTATALRYVPISPGAYIVFDEFHSYPTCEEHEAKAWSEYVDARNIKFREVARSHEAIAFQIV